MRTRVRFLLKALPFLAVAVVVGWLCWPGRVSEFNMWLVRSGMSLERVVWFLGEPDEEFRPDEIKAERFFHWHGRPIFFSEWSLTVTFEHDVVKEKRYWHASF